MAKVFCGIDWGERFHQVAMVDGEGQLVASCRISDDVSGFTRLSELLAEQDADRPVEVALETDRGLLVAALRAAGHRVFAINPKAVDRYRDRYAVSGAKSDPGDALVLAHLLRTDAARHRPIPDDSEQAQAVAVLARAHQDAVWTRLRDTGRLRSLLREFFPAALAAFPNLTTKAALAVLAAAPTPTAAGKLTTADLERLLASTGRGVRRTEVTRLAQTFAVVQLRQPPPVEEAMGVAVQAMVRTLQQTSAAISDLEDALAERFEDHPDAKILRSLPGLGVVLGGRVLGEFGDDRTRFVDAASRRCYAGTAPVTRASGKTRVVLLRRARNQRLANACRQWAFVAILQSPGARGYYEQRRAAGDGHETALRRLASKLVGQLHHCLTQREHYREDSAWPVDDTAAA
ncbi:MAG: IS110 family transposase [Streptosporangiales bacterium]|nr:IS110 family transposase [Streptosporangiales bacterium]